ncbi:hypothetical protein Tsubulata_026703, partial [Turnera subulata]
FPGLSLALNGGTSETLTSRSNDGFVHKAILLILVSAYPHIVEIDMKSKLGHLIKLCSEVSDSRSFQWFLKNPQKAAPLFSFTAIAARYSTECQAQVGDVLGKKVIEQVKTSEEILRNFGCNEDEIAKLFERRPSLLNPNREQLQSKLSLLKELGISAADLVKIITCRPRFLSCRIHNCFEERLEFFMTLFKSKEMLQKAIIRNPSLLTYDLHNKIKPAVLLYERMGVSRENLVPMLLSRPTLIPRTSFDHEKLEYIRKTGVSKDSKMYKHIVTVIGISRTETIQEKLANLEKFGLSDDEIWGLLGRSPLLLTLSVDKVQRNMTFIVGTIKLPANVILKHPFLLYCNLEALLKPRALLAGKIEDMGLSPKIKGPLLLRAMRMREKRFLKVFISCHPADIAEELKEFYENAKCLKRLAADSRKTLRKGFPF